MATEQDWQRARELVVGGDAADAAERAAGRPDRPGDGALPTGGLGEGPLAGQFVELAQVLLAVPPETGVVGVLQRVVTTARDMVPGADVVSVTLRRSDGGFWTPVETDPLASHADRIQYETGEGPCVEATATPGLGVAASSDLATDPVYPAFGPAAAALGLTSMFSTGLFPGGDAPRLGALNYYSLRARGLDDMDRDIALVLAAHASVALHAMRQVADADLRETQLHEALESRDVIGQAKGILMERRGCTAGEAFDVLRRASQDLNVKLRDVAATLATRRAEL